ncbi:hypothetical protein H8F21_14810 [Pseudomonas sp. P66]|uniref:Uncharacterized protein n=1 Tax=Pseudomonas arcuscaelestis TaxID=2710591 RepID=A0ABS2BYY4_9PSED|nr:hypothetical protein [Pseudomonas arcuscaelestis]MBM5458837.1 hypothetical protein [Pseudomonas arcuscaelestis]
MAIDRTELVELAERVFTDHRFCVDEYHRTLAAGVQTLLEENKRLEASLLHINNAVAISAVNDAESLAE